MSRLQSLVSECPVSQAAMFLLDFGGQLQILFHFSFLFRGFLSRLELAEKGKGILQCIPFQLITSLTLRCVLIQLRSLYLSEKGAVFNLMLYQNEYYDDDDERITRRRFAHHTSCPSGISLLTSQPVCMTAPPSLER